MHHPHLRLSSRVMPHRWALRGLLCLLLTLLPLYPAWASALLQPQPGDVIIGAQNAPVTMIEYASLSCPHCAQFHSNVLPALKQQYIDTGKMRYIIRAFPHNEPALRAAMLAECVGPEEYHTYLKVLFGSQDKWAFDTHFLQSLATIAKVGGMSAQAFEQCMANSELEIRILMSRKRALEELNVNAVPTFFINGKIMQDTPDVAGFSHAIDAALSGAVPQ